MSRRIVLREVAPGMPFIEKNEGASIKITSDGIIEIEGAVYVNGPMRAGSHLRVKGTVAFLEEIEQGVKITVTDHGVSPEGFTDDEIEHLGKIRAPDTIGEGAELTASKGMDLSFVGNNVTLIAREGEIELYNAGDNLRVIANTFRSKSLGDAIYINAIKAFPYSRGEACQVKGDVKRLRNPDLEPLTEEEASFVYPFSPSAPPQELETTIPMAEAVAVSAPISLPEAIAVPAPMAGSYVASTVRSPSSTTRIR